MAAPRLRVLGGAVHIPLWLQLKATSPGGSSRWRPPASLRRWARRSSAGWGRGCTPITPPGRRRWLPPAGAGPCVGPDPELAEAYRGLYERVWLRLPDQLGPLAEAGLPSCGGGGRAAPA